MAGAATVSDVVVLAGLVTARHLGNDDLSPKDRQRLRALVPAVRDDRALLIEIPGAVVSLERPTTGGES